MRRLGNVGFDEAFAAHLGPMVRTAWLLTGDRAAAEDAVAEAMAKVWVRHRRGEVREVGPYLRRAVVNEVATAGRRRVVALRGRARISGDARGQRDATATVEDRATLLDALRQLPDRQRQCVVLRFYDQLTVAETAQAMDVTEGTVKSTTARGLAALRTILGETTR